MSSNVATFNNLSFSYETKTIDFTDEEQSEYIEVYSNVIILTSNNSKFKQNDKIEQISVFIKTHFEHEDGTPY